MRRTWALPSRRSTKPPLTSLRAQRSNLPARGVSLDGDCFVAPLLAMTGGCGLLYSGMAQSGGDMPAPKSNTNPYLALGVRPFINCCSVRTMHGGSLMLPQVRAAIDAASRQFVNLDELMEAAGRPLAALSPAAWGILTC